MIKITGHPDMTSAVYRGRRALNQTNLSYNKIFIFRPIILFTCTAQCDFYSYGNDSFKKKNVLFLSQFCSKDFFVGARLNCLTEPPLGGGSNVNPQSYLSKYNNTNCILV